MKWRSEVAREQAWVSSMAARAAAEHLLATEGIVVPYTVVERHPLHAFFYTLVKGEYRKAVERARARNRMKRFVSDVHTVWLTNLAALREHSLQVCARSCACRATHWFMPHASQVSLRAGCTQVMACT
jgi:hypothetical protein